jgi:chromosome segregation ATPase
MGPLNQKIVTAFEDEIIRLDDMVDGMLIEQLEALVARLETTQRKLVELLEQLQAGDESVRAQIEQLEQRRREDLRRLSEVRAQLREEIEQEFMNMDAFSILEKIAAEEQLQAMLQRGEVDRALEQARGELDEVQRMRDQVQERAGAPEAAGPLTEEERQRIALLRELSRLQDEEATLRGSTNELQRAWREKVAGRDAASDAARSAERKAEALQEMIEDINDARLGRDARRGLDDAKAALERLRSAAGREGAKSLELSEAADAALDGIGRALAGSERGEAEAGQHRVERVVVRVHHPPPATAS